MAKYVVPKEDTSIKNKIKNNKEIFISIVAVLIGVLVVMGTSYAVFTNIVTSSNEQKVTVGTFDITFTEGNTVKLTNASPMTDAEGLALTPYTFSISNKGTINAKYRVKLEEDTSNSSNLLAKDKIKIAYSIGNSVSAPRLLSEDNGLVIDEGILQSSQTINYNLRMWLVDSAGNEVQGKTFKAKLVVEAVQFTVDVSDTVPPIVTLSGNLVENIALNSTYTDSGVAGVSDNSDASLSTSSVRKTYEYYNPVNSTTTTVSSIDTSKKGVYYIYYRVTDSNNNVGVAVRVVNVTNNTPPTITLTGGNSVNVALNGIYNEPGYSATDNAGTVITDRVVLSGDIRLDVAGSYVIKYLVTDANNNIASTTRVVVVG